MVIILIKIIFDKEGGSFHILETRQCWHVLTSARLNASLSLLCQFSGLYILAFVVIMVGFTLYCSATGWKAEPTALPQPESSGRDNAALKLEENDSETPAVTVHFTPGETVVVSTN